MVLGCLRGDPAKELTDYLSKARRFPLRPIHRDLASTSENLFSELNNQTPQAPLREQVRQDWIYDETWSAMDARVTALREGAQRTVRQLSQRICAGLSMDWKIREEE